MTVIKQFGNQRQGLQLQISFCDMNSDVIHALASSFMSIKMVEILQGNILHLHSDALVSPANSFGDMGGGLDKAIDDFYKRKAQPLVKTAIAEQFFGEIPVGVAIVLEMKTTQFPFLIVSPTMRIPGSVQATINAYLSMRALLVAILQHNRHHSHKIQTVAIPGLCSGIGGMSPDQSAQQMRKAYDNVLSEEWKKVIHPALAPYL
jgi:O-acetyl-ADP-ribose deacetylase (regulator of RNase III)